MIPNPGSHAAQAQLGCRCDPVLNQFGAGVSRSTCGMPLFEVVPYCPGHGTASGWFWSPDEGRPPDPIKSRDLEPEPKERRHPWAPKRGRPVKAPEVCPGCQRTRKLRPSGRCDSCHETARARAARVAAKTAEKGSDHGE